MNKWSAVQTNIDDMKPTEMEGNHCLHLVLISSCHIFCRLRLIRLSGRSFFDVEGIESKFSPIFQQPTIVVDYFLQNCVFTFRIVKHETESLGFWNRINFFFWNSFNIFFKRFFISLKLCHLSLSVWRTSWRCPTFQNDKLFKRESLKENYI